jgi:hypothetical protein
MTGIPRTTLKRHTAKATTVRRTINIVPRLHQSKRIPLDAQTRAQAEVFERELREFQLGDESTHWLNHPLRAKWEKRLRGNRYHRNDKNTRSNRYLADILRGRIRAALKGESKSARTIELLGCSIDQFRRYLESQFRDGMTWGNSGWYWHIDHKRPCASFDLRRAEDQRACFHFTNLQPLTALENMRKGARFKEAA